MKSNATKHKTLIGITCRKCGCKESYIIQPDDNTDVRLCKQCGYQIYRIVRK